MLTLQVQGLPPGQHGAHVHMTGKCDAPKFESAGGHWNPADAQHGLDAPAGQHAGDMPDRKSVVSGKSVSVRVDIGGRRIIKKKQNTRHTSPTIPLLTLHISANSHSLLDHILILLFSIQFTQDTT